MRRIIARIGVFLAVFLLVSVGFRRLFSPKMRSPAITSNAVNATGDRPAPPHDPNWIDPLGIVLHDSDGPGRSGRHLLGAADLDEAHREGHPDWATTFEGKTYHIGYHYVIRADGEVQPGRPEHCVGTHARAFNNWIGICVIGAFSTHRHSWPQQPTDAQVAALLTLCERLMSEYHIPTRYVLRHRDINETWCPGDRFPYDDIKARLQEYGDVAPRHAAAS